MPSEENLVKERVWGQIKVWYSYNGDGWNKTAHDCKLIKFGETVVDKQVYQESAIFRSGPVGTPVMQTIALSRNQLEESNPYAGKIYLCDSNGDRDPDAYFEIPLGTLVRKLKFSINNVLYEYALPEHTTDGTYTYDYETPYFWADTDTQGTITHAGVYQRIKGGLYDGFYYYMQVFDQTIVDYFNHGFDFEEDQFYHVNVNKYLDVSSKKFNLLQLRPGRLPAAPANSGSFGPGSYSTDGGVPLIYSGSDITYTDTNPTNRDNQLAAFMLAEYNDSHNESDMLRMDGDGNFINGFAYDIDSRREFPFYIPIDETTFIHFSRVPETLMGDNWYHVIVKIAKDSSGTDKYPGHSNNIGEFYYLVTSVDEGWGENYPMNIYLTKVTNVENWTDGYYLVARVNSYLNSYGPAYTKLGYWVIKPQWAAVYPADWSSFNTVVDDAVQEELIIADSKPDDNEPQPGEQYNDSGTFIDGTTEGHAGSGEAGGTAGPPEPDVPEEASLPDEDGSTSSSGSALGMGFIQAFGLSMSDGQNLAAEFGSSGFWNEAKKFFTNNPMEYIISLHAVPISYADLTFGTAKNLICGTWTSVNTYSPITVQRYTIDCGYINLPEWYGDYNDYRESKMMIFLPFIGFKDISVVDCMGRTLHLYYNIDALTGEILAYLLSDGLMLYQWNGNAIINYPLTFQSHNSMINGLINATGNIVQGIGSIASGKAVFGAVDILGGVSTAAQSFKDDVSRSGNLTAVGGWMGGKKPYIYVLRPQRSDAAARDYKMSQGQPSTFFASISSFTPGQFVKMTSIEVPNGLSCLSEEYTMIENILKEGFYA